MSFPFDATLKEIVCDHAAEFAPVFGLPHEGPVTPLNVDLSTLSAATDVALGYGKPLREVVDINFQSSADAQIDWRLHLYNAALGHHFHVPVRSLLILLRPAADHPNTTGKRSYGSGATRVQFNYQVIRLWQRPVKPFLRGGLGLLPLAPLCQLSPGQPVEGALTDLVREIDRRLKAEADEADAKRLVTGAYILTGLRVSSETARTIFRGVAGMEESSTYQHILQLGEQKGVQIGQLQHAHRTLLCQGGLRFGPPTAATEAALASIKDIGLLDRMTAAILTAASWDDLLATP
jgi:hypothetical protein